MQNKNQPAFPVICLNDPCHEYSSPGMTLRDYFAGLALAGFTSCHLDDGDCVMGAADTAKAAYNWADAMLAERARHD